MEIKQIAAAHIEQGSDAVIVGLGTDGVLYEWTCAIEPRTQEQPVMRPATAEELEKTPYRGRTRQVLHADGITAKYETIYIDGCTAGWKALGFEESKVVIHPDDPTKYERW